MQFFIHMYLSSLVNSIGLRKHELYIYMCNVIVQIVSNMQAKWVHTEKYFEKTILAESL